MGKELQKKAREKFNTTANFVSWMKEESLSNRQPKGNINLKVHPTINMLHEYVLGLTTDKVQDFIMEHISLCRTCSDEIFKLMKIENELEQELIAKADKLSVFERIKELVSKLTLPLYIYDPALMTTRGDKPESGTQQYKVGQKIVFTAQAPEDGHFVVFHYDESGNVQLVFPNKMKKDTFITKGKELKISGRIEKPLGRQYVKVIWTLQQILDVKLIDFEAEIDMEHLIAQFLDNLARLDKKDWRATYIDFEVVYG